MPKTKEKKKNTEFQHRIYLYFTNSYALDTEYNLENCELITESNGKSTVYYIFVKCFRQKLSKTKNKAGHHCYLELSSFSSLHESPKTSVYFGDLDLLGVSYNQIYQKYSLRSHVKYPYFHHSHVWFKVDFTDFQHPLHFLDKILGKFAGVNIFDY